MRIENLYQEQVINQCNQNSRITNQEEAQKGRTGGKDIFEMSDEVPVMPSETYNDFAQIVKSQVSSQTEEEADNEDAAMQMPPMPPKPPKPMEEMETEESEETIESVNETVKDTVNSVISAILEAFDISEGEVFEALKSLQLSPSELLNEDGLSSVVNALAADHTTTASENSSEITKNDTDGSTDSEEETLSATMVSLKELMENAMKSLQEKLGMSDEEFKAFLDSSDDGFSNTIADYAGRNMGNENSIQRFMDMLQNQGSNLV